MRKPLKEREKDSLKDSEKTNKGYFYHLTKVKFYIKNPSINDLYFYDLENMLEYIKKEKINNFYIDTIYFEDRKR